LKIKIRNILPLRHLLLMAFTILSFFSTYELRAQVMDNSRKVERLSMKERVSLRTNVVDWALMIPNIGVEYDLRPENWNRYAVNLNLRYRPHTSGTFVRPVVYDIFEATVEGRMYWRERKAEPSGYLRRHIHWWDKLLSCRTMLPSHPKWIFYRGAYLSYSDYNLYLRGRDGKDGEAIMAGMTWGFVKPFIAFQNGNSLDMEFGISAGAAYLRNNSYRHDNKTNSYPRQGTSDWHFLSYPMVRDLHVAVVYRFGKYPIQKKYRWRYDVDMDFRARKDSIYNTDLAWREKQFIKDSLYRVVSRDFKLLYDSCVHQRRIERQRAIDNKAPERDIKQLDALTEKVKKSKKKSAKKG